MKVKVFGEWKDVYSVRILEHDDYNDYGIELIDAFDTEELTDWESIRRDAAIAAMQSLIDNTKATHDHIRAISVAQNAVEYADALIEQLKRK